LNDRDTLNNKEENSMKAGFKIVVLASVLLVFAFVLLHSSNSVSAASAGQVTGTVKLDGTAPHQRPIDMSKDPSCAAAHKDKPITTETVVAGANGGLANVVIYVSQGLTGNEPPSSQPAQLEQKGCQYFPHVVAVDVGQHMKIVNSDQALHNIHPQPTKNPAWNKSQTPGGPPLDVTWANEEIPVPVKCNVHPWMQAFIVVVKGPYGVTDDSGSFKLDNLAPGAYTLTAWQEAYGTQTQNVTVAAGKPTNVSFTFKAK
jgi:plastocyanin